MHVHKLKIGAEMILGGFWSEDGTIISCSFQASTKLGGETESGQFYPDLGPAWVWCALGGVWGHLVQPASSWRKVLPPPLHHQVPSGWTFLRPSLSERKYLHGALTPYNAKEGGKLPREYLREYNPLDVFQHSFELSLVTFPTIDRLEHGQYLRPTWHVGKCFHTTWSQPKSLWLKTGQAMFESLSIKVY